MAAGKVPDGTYSCKSILPVYEQGRYRPGYGPRIPVTAFTGSSWAGSMEISTKPTSSRLA